jgi:Zn-dependent protease with chaperone function
MSGVRYAIGALGLAVTVASPAANAGWFDRTSDYPDKGTAIDALKPAADYSDVVAKRGRAISIMRARDNGFVPSPELNRYLMDVLGRVIAGVPLPASFQPDVKVLASPEFEAVCTPDGTVIVTIGLLQKLDNEDQLAFILAHETSHAIFRHHSSDWLDRSQYYMVASGEALDDMSKKMPSLTQTAGIDTSKFEHGLNIAQHLYKLSSNVLVPQFKKGQEDAADALGFDLLVRAGYSTDAAQQVLEKLNEQEAEAAQAAAEAKRLAAAAESAKSDDYEEAILQNFQSGQALNPATWLTSGQFWGFLDRTLDSLSEQVTTHHSAKDREKLLADYQFREYRHVLPKVPKPLAWNTSKFKAAALIAHYRKADELAEAIAGNSIPKTAKAALLQALAAPTADHAYTGYVAAMYYRKSNAAAQMEQTLRRAAAGPEPSWAIYSQLLNIYVEKRDWARAEELIEQASQRLDNSPLLLPKKIEILRGLGRQADADALVPQCKQYDIRQLSAACVAADGKS